MSHDGRPKHGVRVERFQELDSTSLHARRMIHDGGLTPADGPRLYIAQRQTGGIGRQGRRWHSPEGGLWMTGAWPVAHARPGEFTGVGLRAGVACLTAIRRQARRLSHADPDRQDLDVRLKWPNDLVVGDRKIAGVLVEVLPISAEIDLGADGEVDTGRTIGFAGGGAGGIGGLGGVGGVWVLIGVGVNANFHASELPDDLRRPATTLRDELGRGVDLEALRLELVRELTAAARTGPAEPRTIRQARQHLYGLGHPVMARIGAGRELQGRFAGLTEDGTPMLEPAAGAVLRLTAADELIWSPLVPE